MHRLVVGENWRKTTMIKHSEYSLIFCKADRGPAFDEWLEIQSAAGFVQWDDADKSGGGRVVCPSKAAWNQSWQAAVVRQDYDIEQEQVAAEFGGD
jgi:hypothetical protein